MSNLNNTEIAAKITDEIIYELFVQERWLRKYPNVCSRHSEFPYHYYEDFAQHYSSSILSAIQHDIAKINHLKRIRGHNL